MGTVGLLASYVLSIASRLYSRWSRDTIFDYRNISIISTPDVPNAPHVASSFRLSQKLGSAVNLVALGSLCAFLATASFPSSPHPEIRSSSMNWAPVSLGATLIVAALGYVFSRNGYLPPADNGRFIHTRGSIVAEKAPILDLQIPDGKFSHSGSLLNL
jgi:hypothetical protein